MAESSIFWTTDGTGDGGAEYTQAELIRWLRQTFIGDNTDEGVLKNYANELEVTDDGGADVAINTGGAYVYGFPYWNTASVGKTLSTPSGDVRIDRIVLQADWTAQTVRIAVIEGIEGGAAPALTQTDETKWEISLAQVQIGTDGDIDSVTDEREFIHPNIEIEAAMMASVMTHASTHENGGADEISVEGLSGDLADEQDAKSHASDHERAGSDQVDGDHLDIDFSPSNYTPATTPAEAANEDDLAAHLYGIDQALVESFFGDGSDGDVTISGNTTLTADMYYSTLAVNNGVTLTTDGYRIFVTGTLTNDGTIENNGADASGKTAGAGGGESSVGGGGAGGTGDDGAGGYGTATTGLGGSGGDGGDSSGSVPGGSGGVSTAVKTCQDVVTAINPLYGGTLVEGGAGGAAGAGDGSLSKEGGGGGGGGGGVIIVAQTIDNENGTIQANGGRGGDGESDSGSGGGGGGGGGGGYVILVYHSLTAGTEEAAGGGGGSKGDNAEDGDAGSAGNVIKLEL